MIPDLNNLRESFLYFTECQLATVEFLESLKRPGQGQLKRQRHIAQGMVAACRALPGVTTLELHRISTPRLLKLLFPSEK